MNKRENNNSNLLPINEFTKANVFFNPGSLLKQTDDGDIITNQQIYQ